VTYTAPPAFLAGIPSNLLRRGSGRSDQQRATALLRYCEEAGRRPSFLDLDLERKRRGIR
jgi:hypothetical protein